MLNIVSVRFGFALMISFAATTASADHDDWSYDATIYLFMPETDISFGPLDGSLSFSDALSNLDLAFMGAFEASNGKWSFLANYNYTDLSFSNSAPVQLTSDIQTSTTAQFLSGYVLRRVAKDRSVQLDVGGGFRWFNTDTKLTLTPGIIRSRSASLDEDWTDAVITARLRFAVSDRWFATGFIDYGGFTGDSKTWQVFLTADYAINERWLLRGGYRHISFENELNGNDFRFKMSGPLIGATYRF